MSSPEHTRLDLRAIARCCEGAVPAVVATAAADGTPNVTYLTRVRLVDDERVALSNQFFSKTMRNLAENPRASLVVLDPLSYAEYRLQLVYERTERRGHTFERLRQDVDSIAALTGMQDVFRLRTADIYRVVDITALPSALALGAAEGVAGAASIWPPRPDAPDALALATLIGRISRSGDLDALVATTVEGLDSVLGYAHTQILLLDEAGERLYTIASRGFDAERVGAEIALGEGLIGSAAQQCAALRVGNLRQMAKYSRSVHRSYNDGSAESGSEIPLPGLVDADSRIVVPAVALGQLVGVLVADRLEPVAFDENDEAALAVIATVVANAVEALRSDAGIDSGDAPAATTPLRRATPKLAGGAAVTVRFFAVDGSTFINGDYLIKGVAGRILWSLLRQHLADGRSEFTNRELRLDPTLEMPGFKDNLESRLILLKRRLDERAVPITIDKTGRGRFRLDVGAVVQLESAGGSPAVQP